MGTIKKGILGGFSGKVGNVVGASWKSIAYIRSLPSSVRNPKTEKQLTQRSKFALVAKFVKNILPVIRVGFKQSAGPVNSAFSAAVSYNMHHAVKGMYPGFEIDYARVVVARGALYIANRMTAAPEAGSLDFEWDTSAVNNASAEDRAVLIAYNPGKEEAVYDMDAGTRGAGSGSLDMPSSWEGEKVEAFAVFISEDGTLVSNTMYAGSHEVVAG